MDGLERKKALEALKARANKQLAKREANASRQLRIDLERAKMGAASCNLWKQLDDPKVKAITQVNNRPAEKLVLKKTKGLKREPVEPAIIDPLACGHIDPVRFDMKAVDPVQLAAIRAAQAVVGTICLVVEQEYAAYFAMAHAKSTESGTLEPN